MAALEAVFQFAQKLFKHHDSLEHARLLVIFDAQLLLGCVLLGCILIVERVDLVDDEPERTNRIRY